MDFTGRVKTPYVGRPAPVRNSFPRSAGRCLKSRIQPNKPVRKFSCASSSGKGGEGIVDRLQEIADSGEGLSSEEIHQLIESYKKRPTNSNERSETEEPGPRKFLKFPEGLQGKDYDIPERMREALKASGLWELIPPEGMRAPESPQTGIWTEEEYQILIDEDFEGNDEEEERRELIKLGAIRKLEDALRMEKTDPGEVFDMGLRAKRGSKVKTFFNYKFTFAEIWNRLRRGGLADDDYYFDEEELDDSPDAPKHENDPEVDDFIKLLAQGKQIPHYSTWNKNIKPPEEPESLMKRMNLIKDLYWDHDRKPKDRKVPPEQVKAVAEKWAKFSEEYDSKQDPAFPEEIMVTRAAPDWPEWQDRHHKLVQHMFYLLRSAHIEGTPSEPARRLKKYDLISDDVRLRIDELKIDTKGFDLYEQHMKRLSSVGVTTQGADIFQSMFPPEGEKSEENPCRWEIVCDYYCNVPLPTWFREKKAEEERLENEQRTKEKDAQKEEGYEWKNPLDISDYADVWKDEKKLELLQSIDDSVRSKAKVSGPTGLAEEVPEGQGLGSDDPYPDEGPIWQKEGAKGDAWKDGTVFTINSTAKYVIDIKQGKITEIWIGWGAMIGTISSMQEGEKLYRLAAGMDATISTGDYRSFQQMVYDTCFKNPIDWIKETILDPMLAKKMAGKA
ncbi:hypothetical protein BSKO_11505 [Bryopsis sp. KO-2023]|nr:hypothetical protein BSKO_11505 [Bryopsis sp. KO-2023]